MQQTPKPTYIHKNGIWRSWPLRTSPRRLASLPILPRSRQNTSGPSDKSMGKKRLSHLLTFNTPGNMISIHYQLGPKKDTKSLILKKQV